MFTDELIELLISTPKTIVDAPKEVQGRSSHMKKNFTLVSIDGNYSFGGFITQNRMFTENFSIGLVYNPKGEKGSIILLRCNGTHGPTEDMPHHNSPHIHKATKDRIDMGLFAAGNIEITTSYATYEDAIQFYVKTIGLIVVDRLKYFPVPSGQQGLFDNLGG